MCLNDPSQRFRVSDVRVIREKRRTRNDDCLWNATSGNFLPGPSGIADPDSSVLSEVRGVAGTIIRNGSGSLELNIRSYWQAYKYSRTFDRVYSARLFCGISAPKA